MRNHKPRNSHISLLEPAGQWVLLCLLLLVPAPAALAAENVEVYVGSVTTIYVGTVKRVAVGNDEVVKASVLGDGNVLLLGKAPGVSEVYIWTKGDRRHVYQVRVYAQPQADQASLVHAVMAPFPNVKIKQHLGNTILSGTVDARDFERFQDLAKKLSNVVSLVKPQINIDIQQSIVFDVRIVEINRNYQRTLGVKWQDTGPGPAFGVVSNIIPNDRFGVFTQGGTDDDRLGNLLNAVGTGSSAFSGYFGITSVIGSQLQLLQDEGVARVLAAPSLSTVSGEKATFLAGGDLPVSTVNGLGQASVTFRQFGIQLEIEPVMDRNNNIRSTIRAAVSSIDFSVVVNGVPGLRRRETTSTITARPGETIIISGLVNASDTRNADKVPGLAEIPILGKLFRSDDFQRNRTELVVTVTPRIQQPNAPLSPDLKEANQKLPGVLQGENELDNSLMW